MFVLLNSLAYTNRIFLKYYHKEMSGSSVFIIFRDSAILILISGLVRGRGPNIIKNMQ